MNENFSWSKSVGRWMGIPVRIHLFLILFVAAIFAVELSAPSYEIEFGTAIVTASLLLIAILIHEIAHVCAIANLGGHVNTVVLMPWGGNSDFDLPEGNQSQATVYFSGIFVNAALFGLGAAMLVQSGHSNLSQLTNPFCPLEFDIIAWKVSLIRIFTWINFQILIVNLLPCFPFDGANIVRSFVRSLNFDLPKVRIESAMMVMGQLAAFAIIGLSWIVRDYNPGPIQPAWVLMLLGGVTLLFAARYSFNENTRVTDEEWEDSADMDYDSFYDDTSFFDFPSESEHENSAYSQWLQEKQDARLRDEVRREEEEDRQADEILEKLHASGGGLSSLSSEERSILDRVSARIRKRRQQGV